MAVTELTDRDKATIGRLAKNYAGVRIVTLRTQPMPSRVVRLQDVCKTPF